jgi:hypothetical protein
MVFFKEQTILRQMTRQCTRTVTGAVIVCSCPLLRVSPTDRSLGLALRQSDFFSSPPHQGNKEGRREHDCDDCNSQYIHGHLPSSAGDSSTLRHRADKRLRPL